MNLIVGASGLLGNRVLRRLVRAGEPVRAVSRDRRHLMALGEGGVEAVRGDLLESAWMDGALRGVERLVIAAHGLEWGRASPSAVEGDGVRRLIDAAARAGVRHAVYVSVAAADRRTTAYARLKHATEEHLRASGVPWTVIRPTEFPEHAVARMSGPVLRGGTVRFLGAGVTSINWISVDDVADDVVHVLGTPSTIGTTRELRGPDVLSRLEVLELIEQVLDGRARRQHVPVAALRLAAAVGGRAVPGLAYRLELAVHEARGAGRHQWGSVAWTGTTTVEDVIRRAAARFPTVITTPHDGMATT